MLDEIAKGVAKIGSGEKPKYYHASPERQKVDEKQVSPKPVTNAKLTESEIPVTSAKTEA